MIYSKEDVAKFLEQFKVKLDIYGVIFLDRDKNLDFLRMMGIMPSEREEILKEIEVNDYVSTIPFAESLQMADMWVFGKDVRGRETYIKISIGKVNNKVICISFHIAEQPLKYAFK